MWFAGGGTGGHLYPGLAIARALVRRDASFAPFFIGAQRGIERDVLPGTEFPHVLLDLHPLYRRAPWNNWRTLYGAVGAWRALSRLADKEPPIAVVGTGGYAAGVALAWARAHGVPTMLHEPDSHPGMTTRAFARGARAIYPGFWRGNAIPVDGARRGHSGARCTDRKAPRRSTLARRCPRGVGSSRRCLRGARVRRQSGCARPQRRHGGMVHARPAGRRRTDLGDRARAGCRVLGQESAMVRVRPYLDPIGEAYAAADLAVTRAGAMTIAELCAWGIPSVLVPLPTAAQDHQAHNATAVAASGAAIHLPQAQLDPERVESIVNELRTHRARLDAMRHAARERARPMPPQTSRRLSRSCWRGSEITIQHSSEKLTNSNWLTRMTRTSADCSASRDRAVTCRGSFNKMKNLKEVCDFTGNASVLTEQSALVRVIRVRQLK